MGAVSEHEGAILDTKGLLCPEPVMMLHNKVRQLKAGEVLTMIATDPSTQRDVPRFCQFLGHTLLKEEQVGEEYHYRIQKKS
ncbi:MAG TPA: sulfurtransferase TusA [Alcanivoracaceae bacterium]|nr:sulfurtransferase TusA [Alcanivoracaceae bacterium]